MALCSFSGCLGGSKAEETKAPEVENAEKTDLEYILEKGTLTVGITDYRPMNYLDDNGEWTGFDTEFARLVGESLGVNVEFVIINWNEKWDLLEERKIDCVWNGMTLSEEAKENAFCTEPYIRNSQVVVTRAEDAEKYKDAESLKGLMVAVEDMSAGDSAAAAAGLTVTKYLSQKEALNGFITGSLEGCIIDLTMARAETAEGGAYEDLAIAFALTKEEYAVACRKESDLAAKINDIMESLISDGTLERLAQKYELTLCADL